MFIVRVFLAGLFWLSLPYCTTTVLSMMLLLPLFVPSTVSMGGSACVDISSTVTMGMCRYLYSFLVLCLWAAVHV